MGGVSEGDDVLARWSDGLLYLGNVKRVDGVKQCCLVRFEDNSEFWVLRKDIHSFAVGGEEVCCICDAPPLKDPLLNCFKCRHSYHPECHTPAIEPEADCDSWICRQCVFAVATKRGGALKRGRFARLMQFMKLRLPYQLSSLDWDPQHLTNQQQCYCYCAGPGEWNLKMLQCGGCGQWFHEACTQCLSKPLLYGDRFYEFQCSVCANGPETIQRLPMTWVDLAHLVLYHLSLCCKRKYFDFDHEIMSFTNENWESLLLGALSDTARQDRCHNLLNALNSHKDRFVSGKEIKKKKCLFGLQVRAPPPLVSDSSPLITDPPVNITHRRSPLSLSCQRRAGVLESRKSKRRIVETQPCPDPTPANQLELLPRCHDYGGGACLCKEELDLSSPPKRMFALYHPTYNGNTPLSRTVHHYNSTEDTCRVTPPCLPCALQSNNNNHQHHHHNHNMNGSYQHHNSHHANPHPNPNPALRGGCRSLGAPAHPPAQPPPPPTPPKTLLPPPAPITTQVLPTARSPVLLSPDVLVSLMPKEVSPEWSIKQYNDYTFADYGENDEEDDDPREGLNKEFELSVELTKSRNGSFGFTIARSKLDNSYYVQDILDNPARADGRLRSGDRLVTVNGHDVTRVADELAMTILRSSPRHLSMTLGRAVSNLVAPPSCDSLPDIVLHKTPSGQLGIKLTGGIGSRWQGIYCLEVVPGSPASEEGSVQPNDKIVYICGRCTLGMSLEDAVKACEIAPRKVKLKVIREDHPVTPKAKWNGLFDWKKDRKFFARFEDPNSPEKEASTVETDCKTAGKFTSRLSLPSDRDSCIMQLDFTKPENSGLGFALIGGANGSVLRVKEICTGGLAEQDGRLRVGDILLEVNGVIVSGLSHGKVVDILRRAEGVVQLTICRDFLSAAHPRAPPPAADRTLSLGPVWTDPAPDPCGSPEAAPSKPVEHRPEAAPNPTVEVGVFAAANPYPIHRLAVVRDENAIDQESCNSTPSHPACCPSLSVSDMLHGASDRKQFVTTLLEQHPKCIRINQSDGWSSDEEDEDAVQLNRQEMTSVPTGPPIVSEGELASLALITPSKNSRYYGSRVKALIQILQNQLDQEELVKEFMALEHLKPSDNCLVGKAPENRDKNRYRDILPYDKTRVALGEARDYINASYIRMAVGPEEFQYISCQGPLPATARAFWQMVWENKSDVVAMMTQEVERGRIKCHKYWPETPSQALEEGRFQLHLVNQQSLDYFHIKVIRMEETQTGATHVVRHLKFTHWPDHGVPHSSEQLVRFIRYLRAVHHSGPLTVHCSAGIGRTGVLICTDVILSLIENDLPINVGDIVREMRLQRYGMIQTKEQYLFCYKVWLDVLQGILRLHGNQWQPDAPLEIQMV